MLIKISNLQWQKWPVDKKITLELKEQAKEIRDKAKDIINKSIKKKKFRMIQCKLMKILIISIQY